MRIKLLSYGILSVVSILAVSACFYAVARIGILALPPAIVFSLLFIISAKSLVRCARRDHFEVVTLRGVEVIGYSIDLFDNHLFLVINGDVTHYVEKRDIKYIDIISQSGERRLSASDFIGEFYRR